MKKLNINGKRSGFFTRGMAALCLSIVFESKSCFGSNLRAYQLASMPYQNFVASVEQCPDVSDWKDERGRYVFYIAVKYGYANKVQAILENFIQKKEAGFKHTNEDFINAFDRRTGATALWEAIRSGQNEVIEIFTKKKYSKYIDINKIQCSDVKKIVDSGENSLWFSLKNYDYKIANILLRHPNIDIKTKDPTSGNTVLHVAIESSQSDMAKTLIDRLKEKEKDLELLFAQNNDGDTPLHLAMKYKLPDVQSDLIKLASEDKLWIKNNAGEDMLGIAVDKHQPNGMVFLTKQPLERLCRKYKNGETLLHVCARLKFASTVQSVLGRIRRLGGSDEMVKQLFEQTTQGKTIWESIYLSRFGIQPINNKVNIEIFKDTIAFVQASLKKADWDTILEGINNQENAKCISNKYATQLRDIVKQAAGLSCKLAPSAG